MAASSRRLKAVVHGLVQGVGYRMFTQREARRLVLDGWVRNRVDGSVEVLAEGPETRLTELLERLRQGPPGGSVIDIDVNWAEAEGGLHGFSIRH